MSNAAPARALTEQRIAMLTRLAEIGMTIAEEAGRRALDPDGDAGFDAALSYSRAARAVRLTLALQAKLMDELAARDRDQAITHKHRIRRKLDQIIEDHCDDEDEAERLSTEAWERLIDLEDDADLADAPITEVVVRICAHLGLSPEVTAEAIAQVSDDPPVAPAKAPFRPLAPRLPAARPSPATGVPPEPG